ncbi:MAG: 7-cyano-7-deazaguanine synthase [Thermoanaerobaculaceae bacterium]
MVGLPPVKSALLLSGGIDSAAMLFWKRPTLAITIDYGQAAALAEIRASKYLCTSLGIPHAEIQVDCRPVGAGLMAGTVHNTSANLNPEWWPFRNQLLITLGAAYAVGHGFQVLLIGTVKSDGGRHRDGSPEFLRTVDRLVRLQEGAIRVLAPGLRLSSAEVVRKSKIPRGLLLATHSCHVSQDACGRCPGCRKHSEVVAETGVETWDQALRSV